MLLVQQDASESLTKLRVGNERVDNAESAGDEVLEPDLLDDREWEDAHEGKSGKERAQ